MAWSGYLAYLLWVNFGMCVMWQLPKSSLFFLAGKVYSVVILSLHAGSFLPMLPYGFALVWLVLAYFTVLSYLVGVDQDGQLVSGSKFSLTPIVPQSDFVSFARFLHNKFKQSAPPFVFVSCDNVFCRVSYAGFSRFYGFSDPSIYCNTAMKALPLRVSACFLAHEASHLYYADIWFRWWLDVLGLWLFFIMVSDVASAISVVPLLLYCRIGLVRAQEVWADFSALTGFSSRDHKHRKSTLHARVEALFYVSSFEENHHAGFGWCAVIRSCFFPHPQGWLRGAIQLLFLRLSHGPVSPLQSTFSWVGSNSRRICCQESLQFFGAFDKRLYALVVVYLVLQAPFLCVVGLQRLLVTHFRGITCNGGSIKSFCHSLSLV